MKHIASKGRVYQGVVTVLILVMNVSSRFDKNGKLLQIRQSKADAGIVNTGAIKQKRLDYLYACFWAINCGHQGRPPLVVRLIYIYSPGRFTQEFVNAI